MARKIDKLFEELAKDEEMEKAKAESEAPNPEETPKDEEPKEEPEELKPDETPKDEEPKEEPEEQKKPAEEPKPDDKFQRAEFSFRRQLGKQKDKYEESLKARDEKIKELEKKLADIDKRTAPKEPLKTRDDFKNDPSGDEAYIRYLADQRVKELMAERDEANAKKDAEREEQEKKRKEQEAEIAEQQQQWLNHVQECFGSETERAQKFLSKIQYANSRGLGEILDNCPTAADFLMHDKSGPKVFEKVLDDAKTFHRVFDSMNPMAVYFELRSLAKEMSDAPQQQATQPKASGVAHLGKPGKQGGTGTAPDIFSDAAAMRDFIRS